MNGKTQMFSLDDLTDTRISQPAAITGIKAAQDLTADTTYNFSAVTAAELKSMFTIDVDGSGNPVTVDLSHLAGTTHTMTGVDIAKELTNVLNAKFGDERYFDLTNNTKFQINASVGGVNRTAQLDLSTVAAVKVETIDFAAAMLATTATAGVLTVAGVAVTLALGDTPIQVATKVKAALDLAPFILGPATPLPRVATGRAIADDGAGKLTLTWTAADEGADNVVITDTGGTGASATTAVPTAYVAGLPDVTKATKAAVVAAMQAAVTAAGLTTVTVGFDEVNRGFTFKESGGGAISLQAPQSFKDFTVVAPTAATDGLNITLTKLGGSAVTLGIVNIAQTSTVDDMVTKLTAAAGYSSSGFTISNVDGSLHVARNDGVAFTALFANSSAAGATAYSS